jgi:hypothetical protein
MKKHGCLLLLNLNILTWRGWRLAIAPAVAAALTILAFVSPAPAQGGHMTNALLIHSNFLPVAAAFSINPTAPTGIVKCATVDGTNVTSYCDGPTTTIFCGGPIGATNDFSGIPINWTFTNGNVTCVNVTYSFSYTDSRKTCDFYFYVPNGFATTKIKATLSNGTQESLDEEPVNGWQHWFKGTGITSLTFTDGNGTTHQEMGWGSTASWSIERLCS